MNAIKYLSVISRIGVTVVILIPSHSLVCVDMYRVSIESSHHQKTTRALQILHLRMPMVILPISILVPANLLVCSIRICLLLCYCLQTAWVTGRSSGP